MASTHSDQYSLARKGLPLNALSLKGFPLKEDPSLEEVDGQLIRFSARRG